MTAKLTMQVKLLLSTRVVSFMVVVTAIAARILQLVFFYNIRVDASYQIIATDAFVRGHGISRAVVNPQNLSEVIYTPLLNWPPGFSLLLTPFYWLFKGDYIAAGLTLDVLVAIMLILTCRRILQLLELPLCAINLFTLVNGLFIYAFYSTASSDDIAASFFIVALYYFLRLIKDGGNKYVNVILLTFFLFVTASIKYLFLPAVFVMPLLLVFIGHRNKVPFYKKAGWASFVSLVIPVVAFLLYGLSVSDSIGPASTQQSGFFPEHLLDAYPFITASFMTTVTSEIILTGKPVIVAFVYRAMQLTTMLLIVLISYHLFLRVRKKGFRNLSVTEIFLCAAFLLSAAVFGVLTFLSVTVSKEQHFATVFWTYVQEARYYGLVTITIHLAFFVLYKAGIPKVSLFFKSVFYGLALLLFIELCRSGYFHFNRIRLFGKEEYSWQYEDRFQKYAHSIIQYARKAHPSAKVIVSGSSYYYNHRFSLYSHVPVLYELELLKNPGSLNSEKPVVVVAVLSDENLYNEKGDIFYKGRPAGKFEEFSFFILYVAPK
jgi:hypothetical protein